MAETIEIEEWRDIPEYPGYQASNLGQIRSKDIKIIDYRGRECQLRNRIYKQQVNKLWPYLYVRFGPHNKTLRAHRIIAKVFIPNPDNLPEVNHKNGIKSDNRVVNLEWTDAKENSKHAYRIGLHKPSFGNRKLTDEQVEEIKYLLYCGAALNAIAKELNVSYSMVHKIRERRSWV